MVYELSEALKPYDSMLRVEGKSRRSERGFLIEQVDKLTYIGSELEKITEQFISILKEKKGLNLEGTIDYVSLRDVEVDLENLPFRFTAAKFSDNEGYVKGEIKIRVTGPHPDGMMFPLLDFELRSTKKGESEADDKLREIFTDWKGFRDIVQNQIG